MHLGGPCSLLVVFSEFFKKHPLDGFKEMKKILPPFKLIGYSDVGI